MIIKYYIGYLGVIYFLTCFAIGQIHDVHQTPQTINYQQAEQWIQIGSYHAARQEFEKIFPHLSSAEDRRNVLFFLLQSTFEDQEYEAAYYWATDFLREFPNDGRKENALFYRGVSAFQTNRLYEAQSSLDEFLAQENDNPYKGAAFFWRAMIKLDKNDWQSAEVDVQNCYEDSTTESYHDIALFGWALSLERRGENHKAIELLEKFITKFAYSSLLNDVKIRLASLSLRAGMPLRSIEILDSVEPTSTQWEEYLILRAEAEVRMGRYESARSSIKMLLDDYPDSRYTGRMQYSLAWSYLKERNYPNASIVFDSLGTGSDSLAFAALYQAGAIALLQNKPIDALARFDSLTEKSPYDNYAEKGYFQIGMIHYRHRQYRDARRAFQLAARLFSRSENIARSYYMLGETNVALGDFSNAQYAFARTEKLNGSPDIIATSMFQSGVCLYHLGRFKSSAEKLNDFLSRSPKNERVPEAYVWQGEALYQDGKFAEAERSFSDALRLYPDNPKRINALYGLAWTFFEQKKFFKAIDAFNRYTSKYPDDIHVLEATLRQADCYAFLGDYDKSNALYLSIGTLKKDNKYNEYAAFQIAMSYTQRGETDRGIEQLRNFLIQYPSSIYNEVAQFNIGWTYFSKNQYREALKDFQVLQIKYPQSQLMPRVLFNMGDCYYNLKQYDSARIYYGRVPKEFPTSPLVVDALSGLQYTYEAAGKPSAAVAEIDALMNSSEVGLSKAELVMKKGDILFGQGDFGGAAVEYQKLLTLKPSKPVCAKSIYQLGRVYEMENNTRQSMEYYKRVITEYPEMEFAPNAALGLGIANIKVQQFDAAEAVLLDFEKRFSSSSLLPEARYRLGIAYMNNKDNIDALNQFQKVIQNHPLDIFADRSRLQIAKLYMIQKEYRVSIDTLSGLVSRRNDDVAAEALLMIGENYLLLKKPIDALQTFKDVFKQYTEFPLYVEKAHFGAAKSYERLGNRKQARSEYEQVVKSSVDLSLKKDAQDRLRRLKK